MKNFKHFSMLFLLGFAVSANAHTPEKSFLSWLFGHHHSHHGHHDGNKPNNPLP